MTKTILTFFLRQGVYSCSDWILLVTQQHTREEGHILRRPQAS